MPARTGAEYIANLRENGPEVYLHGEQVKDVTTHPALRGGVETLARLYDMQHDPAIRDEMTYESPTTGDRVGTSFIMPRTMDDLESRRVMMRHWARATFGMMGRSPDFMNVNMMAMAAAGDYFAQNRPEFKDNINWYYEHIRENDLVLTHTLLNLQRSRTPGATPWRTAPMWLCGWKRRPTRGSTFTARGCLPRWRHCLRRLRCIPPPRTSSQGRRLSPTHSLSPWPTTPRDCATSAAKASTMASRISTTRLAPDSRN